MISKFEKVIGDYLKLRFVEKFEKTRPGFLLNPKSGSCLEYDFYNSKMKLAIEYNGEQHYKYIKKFHKSEEDFEEQIYRDQLKQQLSQKNNIHLIIIPHNFERIIPKTPPYAKFDSYVTRVIMLNLNVLPRDVIALCYLLEEEFNKIGYKYSEIGVWINKFKRLIGF